MRQLVNCSKDRITKFYELNVMGNRDLEIVEAGIREVEGSGQYYRFTVKDSKGKTAVVNIDKLLPPPPLDRNSGQKKLVR